MCADHIASDLARDIDFSRYHAKLKGLDTIKQRGRVAQVIGLVIESDGPHAQVGEICSIYPRNATLPVTA
ncbi:MAG TPA: hypothetical protein PK183_02490, partial [Bacillota bacterium]|nr:hypothetical protein [Bacillota bacterium]